MAFHQQDWTESCEQSKKTAPVTQCSSRSVWIFYKKVEQLDLPKVWISNTRKIQTRAVITTNEHEDESNAFSITPTHMNGGKALIRTVLLEQR